MEVPPQTRDPRPDKNVRSLKHLFRGPVVNVSKRMRSGSHPLSKIGYAINQRLVFPVPAGSQYKQRPILAQSQRQAVHRSFFLQINTWHRAKHLQ